MSEERFSRLQILYGTEALRRLSSASVAVVSSIPSNSIDPFEMRVPSRA